MRALLSFAFATAIMASVACRDEALPTGPQAARPSKDLVTIDLNQLVDITAGDNFTCVTRANGNVFCWGENSVGQTGHIGSRGECWGLPSPMCTPTPTLVINPSTGSALLASHVDAGGSHVCMADFSRTAWCWGSNGVGQLGRGSTWSTASTPDKVA